jgi:hemolysin B
MLMELDSGDVKVMKKERLMQGVRATFRPEFLNRIDDVVCFESLSKEQLHQILEILVKNTNNALKNRNIFVELTDKAKEFVVEKGTDLKNGARPLRRAVQRYIEDTVTDGIFNEQIQDRRYCKTRY